MHHDLNLPISARLVLTVSYSVQLFLGFDRPFILLFHRLRLDAGDNGLGLGLRLRLVDDGQGHSGLGSRLLLRAFHVLQNLSQ